MKIATSCVCCGSNDLKKSPSVLMPFIAHRIFDIAPVEITDDWDVKRYGIKNGMVYARCNSVCCSNCLHTFLDMRFDDDELNLLYDNYREEEYINLRDHYEPGYKQKNEHLSLFEHTQDCGLSRNLTIGFVTTHFLVAARDRRPRRAGPAVQQPGQGSGLRRVQRSPCGSER